MGSYGLKGTVSVLQDEKVWRWMVVMITQQYELLHDLEMCTKMVKTVNFMLRVFDHIF